MQRRKTLVASAAALCAVAAGFTSGLGAAAAPAELASSGALGASGVSGASAAPSGSFALSGAAARSFVLPAGLTKVSSSTRPDGATQTRYQQFVGKASVLGGQVTVNANAGGTVTSVIGAYFPGLTTAKASAKAAPNLTASQAKAKAVAGVGASGRWATTLGFDPRDGNGTFVTVYQPLDTQARAIWLSTVD